jgi:hypothetical protein
MQAQVFAPLITRTRALAGVAVLAALGLYLLTVDQGLALSLVQGGMAFDQNVVHELLHDGRHVLGAPCH